MGKMLGKAAWSNRCACCNGPDDHKLIRTREKRDFQREVMTEAVKYAYLKFRNMDDKELIVRVVDAVDEGWFNKYDESDRRKIADAMKRRGWLFNGLVKGEPDSAVDLDTLI